MSRPQLPVGADEYAFYLSVLLQEREGFLALHTELQSAHPDWIPGQDARLGIVAKSINLLLNAAINIRLTQSFLIYPQWWAANVSAEFGTLETMKAPLFDLQLFYRYGLVILLLSSIEHGFRAIQPR